MKPPLVYFGGKMTMADHIVSVLPPHRHYVEPFGGSLAVLLAKPPSQMETVNDADGELMHFWRILRDRPDELIRACALTPHSRAEYHASYDRPADLDDVERARRVWVCLTQGRGATLRRSGWRHYVKPTSTIGFPGYLDAYIDRMAPVVERLHSVSLEQGDALALIEKYGAEPDVLLYVDPPYLGQSRAPADQPRNGTHRYQVEMLTEDEHAGLLTALRRCRASVVLSGYPSALYDEHLADWHTITREVGTGQSARSEWSRRTEVIWCNRAAAADLFSGADEQRCPDCGEPHDPTPCSAVAADCDCCRAIREAS